ncbi:FMN-dependent NADH-azoreductase [Actibacterium sp. 188UL27-1]|uniref:FMN-dependent NADH-azoreductase n=1 Tax=Actibacterium sp. 188UL27-1 TaxID=2786961 RepID=UPI00195AD50F|nr:NAD(P)H-dependent oxidoreductase [Actibacterium sp. 188UL27-1]MBM7067008.1 NAD(P)H-dependent oxidoreductase [Actibacterium sp. 188UL27-1]
MVSILHVNSSARMTGSASRLGGDMVVEHLRARYSNVVVVEREAVAQAAFLSEEWIGASFTHIDDRSAEQDEILATSNALAQEVLNADILVLGVAMYNFGLSSAMKAWIDHVARPGITFRPDPEHTYVGLATGKKAYIVLASGETSAGSEMDFATPYLKHVLEFLGIRDVQVIGADLTVTSPGTLEDRIKAQVAQLT